MQYKNLYDPKALAAKQAREIATLVKLTPEAMDAATRVEIKSKAHREVIAASLAAHYPALPSQVCELIDTGRGGEVFDLIGAALVELREFDPILFEPIPDRDQMLRLAIQWRGGTVSDAQRASLWASFCDRAENERLQDAYRFKWELQERGEALKAARTFPTAVQSAPVHTSPKIGGTLENGDTRDASERPAKIAGVNVPEPTP